MLRSVHPGKSNLVCLGFWLLSCVRDELDKSARQTLSPHLMDEFQHCDTATNLLLPIAHRDSANLGIRKLQVVMGFI